MAAFGTFRTWRDVRLESVVRSKADFGDWPRRSAHPAVSSSAPPFPKPMKHLVLNRSVDVLSCELVKVLHCFMFRLAVPDDRADPNGNGTAGSFWVRAVRSEQDISGTNWRRPRPS